MSQPQDELNRVIDKATAQFNTYPSSFAEVRDALKDKYSERTWRGKLAAEISGTTNAKSREYLNARRNVERWNTGKSNFEKAKQGNKEAVARVGETLDPIRRDAPQTGLEFHVKGKQKDKHGHERTREFEIKMDYATSVKFVNNVSDGNFDLEDFYDEYFDGAGDLLSDGDYELYDVAIS